MKRIPEVSLDLIELIFLINLHNLKLMLQGITGTNECFVIKKKREVKSVKAILIVFY